MEDTSFDEGYSRWKLDPNHDQQMSGYTRRSCTKILYMSALLELMRIHSFSAEHDPNIYALPTSRGCNSKVAMGNLKKMFHKLSLI